MTSAFTSLFSLRWTSQTPLKRPLPDHISRTYINTPSAPTRKLELLYTEPPSSSCTHPSLLFLHGGFGHASLYIPFMTALHDTTQCFALSLRNHGASDPVSYLRMVYGATIAGLSGEVVAAIEHIVATTGTNPILVGHSSGGGLAQYMLATKQARARGLVLLDAVPHLGNFGVYTNWARHDPWFGLRMSVHAFHVASPLSTVRLVRGAFFGDGSGDSEDGRALSDGEVEEFMGWMPGYESLVWPLQMFGSFWAWLVGRPRWLNARDVIGGLDFGRDGNEEKENVCVVVGDRDVLMDVEMCKTAIGQYRNGISELVAEKKVDRVIDSGLEVKESNGGIVERGGGVRFVVVKGAGHHVQNDVQWKFAAEALKQFVVQV